MEHSLAPQTSIELRLNQQRLNSALADAGYQIQPGTIAGCTVPHVILLDSAGNNLSAPQANMVYFNQMIDWRYTMPPFNGLCALISDEPEMISLKQIGGHAHG